MLAEVVSATTSALAAEVFHPTRPLVIAITAHVPLPERRSIIARMTATQDVRAYVMADRMYELRDSNDAKDDSVELRRRIADEGYLFFRRLIEPSALLALRADILGVMGRAGWLESGTDPIRGIANIDGRCTEGDSEYSGPYGQVQRLESFHRLPHAPELVGMVQAIMGASAMPLPGHKARIWFPKFTDHTTPTHQDFVHYQGSLDTLTCWAPVGDCPIELGPLAVLERSHKVRKVLTHHFSLGAGGLVVNVEEEKATYPELSGRWLSTDFEVGDALFFPALTVHRALPNTTENLMRISLDNRYQREGGRIAEHMLLPHMYDFHKVGWDEIYRDWESDELKYYWRRHNYRRVKKNTSFRERGTAEAMQLARVGDEHALIVLQRIVKASDPEAEQALEARAILAAETGAPHSQ